MDRRATDRRLNNTGDMLVLDVEALLAILWRRRFLVIFLAVLILIPGVAYVAMKPSYYKATTSVIIENQDLNLTDFKDALPNDKFDDMTIETQSKLIASSKLIYQTLDTLDKEGHGLSNTKKTAPGKGEDSRRYQELKEFLAHFTVLPLNKSRVIEFSYISNDPEKAANIVNTHANQYIEYQVAAKREQINAVNDWISSQIENLKKESQKKSLAIQDFRTEAGIVLGKNSQDLIEQQISDLTGELVPIETKKLSLQAQLAAMENSDNADANIDVSSSSLIASLKSQSSAAKQELKSLSPNLGKNHPSYRAAKKRVDQVDSDIAREVKNAKSTLKTELDSATKQEEFIRARLEELNRQADELREKEVALESLESEETANKTLLENFMARAEEIKSQLDYDRPDVHIVSPAEIPTDPIGTRRSLLLVVMAMFAGIAAVSIVLALELLDRGIEDPEEIKKTLNLKLIGILPQFRSGQIPPMNYQEEIKRIYLALAAKKSPQSLLFTSSRQGEGKSTIALSLARYLASIKAKVVLVDANTSRPVIATLAGIKASPGFADIMAGADLSNAIYRDETGLPIIPSGNNTAHPVDLLATGALSELLAALKTQYDYVIVDGAPMLVNTDAEIISGQVDQVILIIEWAKTHKKYLKKIALALRQHAKDVPGVILNKRP